jgi:putative membrane protein
MWEEHWAHHPIWWPVGILAISVFLLVLLGWALLNLAPVILGIVAAVLGIRWLRKASEGSRSDPAVSVLRERYARGDIGKEEFEAKLRDLGGRP